MTMNSFKYRQNLEQMEQTILAEFDLSHLANDAETAEQAKRNRVVQISELLERARAANYLEPAELADLHSVDKVKLQQVLARCTNEILVSIQVPLRRQKAEQQQEFETLLLGAGSETERESMKFSHKERMSDVELTCWLKDFPKTASDFKELRRCAA